MTRLYPNDREPIQVTLDDLGSPLSFYWQERWHPVDFVANRWRLLITWWSVPAERDYWRLATQDGLLVEIYRDMVGGRWYLARLYD